ncbi:MAG: hypothetical protein AB1918_00600 [Pseudomonadota bacterium]
MTDRPPGEDHDLRLGAARARLDTMLGSVEATFLTAGERLGQAVEVLSSVQGSFDGLSALVASEELDGTVRRLADIPSALAAAASANSRGATALQRLDDLARGLDRPLARLRKTVGEVQVLAINGRVEAAHVNAMSTDFSVFTRDMGALASQAMAALDRLGRELEQLNRLTVAARADRDEVARAESDALAEIARRLRASVDAVAYRRRETGEAARRVGELSAANAANIGQAIGALQIGDIARQRVEHVMHALDNADPARLGPLCRLQAMQLDHAARELGGEVDRARATFARLAADTGALRSRAADGFRAGSDGTQSFLHALAADLRDALTAMEAYHRDARALQARLEPVIRTVAAMAAHVRSVRDIEADMRIMGLNATLKCGRLGSRGRALGVIAQALRAQAGHTADYAGQVMAGLEEISAVTTGLAEAMDAGTVTALKVLDDAVTVFEAGGRTMNAALSLLSEKVDQAGAALAEVQGCFEGDAMVTCLETGALDLTRLADDLGAPPIQDNQWGDDLAHSYTMASQREVHARFSGMEVGVGGGSPAASLDDIFF